MTNDAWVDILRRFPPEQHSTLILATKTGTELTVETIFRLEPTYLVMRGRVSGLEDSGRAFFVPYSELDYVYINRIVTEHEVRALYGEPLPEAAAPAPAEEPAAEAAAEPAGSSASVTPLSGQPTAADAAAAAKINLLERIRAARATAGFPRS
jgi:hypothetical protein